jgi:hypothetical protein
MVLSTFVVTNTWDNGGVNPAPGAGTGTLRQAIVDADAAGTGTAANPDLIQFDIPTTDPGYTAPTSVVITDVSLSNDVATLATSPQVPVALGHTVIVTGLSNSVFDGNYQVIAETATSFSYTLVHADVPSTADSGTASDPGQFTITPRSALPQILEPVVINGFSQPGSSPNTMPNQGTGAGDNAIQNIILDGSQTSGHGFFYLGSFDTPAEGETAAAAAAVPYGLVISGGNSTVTGLAIQHFGAEVDYFVPGFGNNLDGGGGIHLMSSGNSIAGNYLANNSNTDIFVANESTNTIGGTNPGARNLCLDGVTIQGSEASGNVLEGNYICTDGVQVTGGFPAVSVSDASNNVLGGTALGAGNVIAGGGQAIVISAYSAASGDQASGNLVQGNYIGLNPAGTAVLPELGPSGILLFGTSGNTIGGNTPAARNAIAGSWRVEVGLIQGFWPFNASEGDAVRGNYIGTNAAGSPLPTFSYVNSSDDPPFQSGSTLAGLTR